MNDKIPQVLLIDDSPDMHKLIACFFSSLDVELLHAFGGHEGLRIAEDRHPMLILLDYMMPGFDGIAVLEKLKEDPALSATPVIMITAENNRALITQAFEKGVCDYVTKPLHANEFRARVQAAVRNQAMLTDLKQKSLFDALTGLPNKSNLLERLQNAIERTRGTTTTIGLMFIDLDRFKMINDSLGHAFGDLMLQEASCRLRRNLRKTDTVAWGDGPSLVARLGGDEFVVLLESMSSPKDAEVVAQRILNTLIQPYEVSGRTLYLGASIGVVTCNGQYDSPGDMIRDADIAMYEAKGAGRGCFKVFDTAMRDRAQVRWKLDSDLRRAIELNEFCLHYQPIVELETGEVESVEALIRWEHPSLGMISPDQFIPMAEETGTIIDIGQWVLRTACKHFVEWTRVDLRAVPKHVSVNLSRQQLTHGDFMRSFRSIVRETGIDPTSIHLEITESEVMNDLAASVSIIEELRFSGVKIDLDDFGTGYSSLACLHQIPIDVIKLDRSLITAIDKVDYFRRLAQLVLQLLAETQINVIAEGIETEEQFLLLKGLRCSMGQGYFFSRPMPAHKVQDFVRAQRNAKAWKFVPVIVDGTDASKAKTA